MKYLYLIIAIICAPKALKQADKAYENEEDYSYYIVHGNDTIM